MSSKNRIRAIAILIVMLLLLTSCQEGVRFNQEERQLSGRLKVLITDAKINNFSTGYNPVKERIKQFMELHPNVQIEVEMKRSVDIGGRPIDYKTIYGNDVPFPDIIELSPNQIRMSLEDAVEDLSPYFSSEFHNSWSGDYRRLIDAAAVDGKPYLMPIRSFSSMVYYDKALIEEKGFIDPQQGWTWEQFVNIAQQLKQEGYPVGLPMHLLFLEPIVRGQGGVYSSEQLEFSGYLDSEETIQAMRQLRETNLLTTDNVLNPDGFVLGVATLINADGGIRRRLTREPNIAVAPFPSFERKEYQLPSHITGLAVSNNSQNKELAWELIKYIVGPTDEEALDFVAYYTILFENHRYYTEPHVRDLLLFERIRKDMAFAVQSAFTMSTNTNRIHYLDGGLFIDQHTWQELIKIISFEEDIGAALREVTDSMERQMATFYVW